MRIGIDARLYSTRYTGIGRYVKELVDHILEIDETNEYILFFNDPEYTTYTPPNNRVSKRRVRAAHYSWREQTTFVSDLNRENLDLAHFTHFNMPVLYKRPSVVTIHDLTISKFPEMLDKGIVEKLAYTYTIKNAAKVARAVICISENTKEDAIRMLGADVKKTRVIYEAVGPEFMPVTDETKLEEVVSRYRIDKPFILYMGGFRKHKNLPALVKAYNLFRNRTDAQSLLVLAGNPDPADPEVETTIHGLGLDTHVLRPGYIPDEDLPALYSAAQVFAFPSLYEGFGLPPLEAMACGTPVVASNVSSIPEVLGDAALYANPHDTDELSAQIARAFTDEALRADLVKRGHARVQQFSWQKMAGEVLQVYKDVVAQAQAAMTPPAAPPAPATPPPAAPPAA